MSAIVTQHSRHPRLSRIVLTGSLLIAVTVSIAVFGQTALTTPAAAASVRESVPVQSVVSDTQLITESADLRAVVRQQQDAKATARAAAATPTVNVWTAGWQAQINECRGGVDITSHYGIRTVAQHWGCGGGSFPTNAGAVVQFSGLDAGTYRVIGVVAVLNAYMATTNQLPHGYDMLFQTCRDNDSHTTEFIGLQKVD